MTPLLLPHAVPKFDVCSRCAPVVSNNYWNLGNCLLPAESGKRTLLVQFATPFSVDGDAAHVQQTASGDVLECVNGMRHSILPGDKVLAPWEPGQKRYGPGTVLRGMETRDPLREKEDEEITVSFWNGKKATVPRGVALWISPLQWQRIVEMIHMPHTSRKQLGGPLRRASCHVCACGPVAACTCACTLGDLQRSHWPYCSFPCPCYSCFHHSCSLLGHMLHTSCSCPKYSDCWWQPSSAKIPQGNVEEEISSKPTPKLLALEGPPKEEPATAPSSPSSDSQSSGEMGLTKSTMVDHAVNTDCSLFEQPKLQAIRRPDWKYWRRNHPSAPCKSQAYFKATSPTSNSSMESLLICLLM
uniref:DUF4537 domain-containing protein n=1 Tax=Varanus komodoensis TaxID=61221 RepID=A0A8D2L734_VARKO